MTQNFTRCTIYQIVTVIDSYSMLEFSPEQVLTLEWNSTPKGLQRLKTRFWPDRFPFKDLKLKSLQVSNDKKLIPRSVDMRDFGNRCQISKIWFQVFRLSDKCDFDYRCQISEIRFRIWSFFLKGSSDIVLAWPLPQCQGQIFFRYAKFCLGFRDRRMQGMKQMFKSKPPPPPELVRRLLRSLRNLDELTGSKNNEKREQEGKAIR